MKNQAPIECEIKVGICGKGQSGTATIGLGHGKFPTSESIRKSIDDFIAKSMPDGFRLMNPSEWLDFIGAEENKPIPPTLAPVVSSIKISITDTKQDGVIEYDISTSGILEEADFRKAFDGLKETIPDGFRLMTKQEWWDSVCVEKFGQAGFALPGGPNFDD